jgi:hypothetical protein
MPTNRKKDSIMKLLDVVALLEAVPNYQLYRGQVGTIVEVYEPKVFEVEFSDLNGRAYAIETGVIKSESSTQREVEERLSQ